MVSWFDVATIQRCFFRFAAPIWAVEALGAADGPLRVAHDTGGKLMSTSQGAGWGHGTRAQGWREV